MKKSFIYNNEYLVEDPSMDETGRFPVNDDYYKEELKEYVE